MTSICTEKSLRDMMAEDLRRIKTEPMNHGAIVSLAIEIKRMDLFRQQLETKRILDEMADVP